MRMDQLRLALTLPSASSEAKAIGGAAKEAGGKTIDYLKGKLDSLRHTDPAPK